MSDGGFAIGAGDTNEGNFVGGKAVVEVPKNGLGQVPEVVFERLDELRGLHNEFKRG